jgi:hypothetical protein
MDEMSIRLDDHKIIIKKKHKKKLKVSKKKLKREPSLKKPGDFTVAEGHRHPLVGGKVESAPRALHWESRLN